MPRDFTFDVFKQLLLALKEQRYTFQTFAEFLKSPAERVVILRHDVDARKLNSLQSAKIEAALGITGTYYFRIVPQSYDPEVIRQIAALGHEIGYHYEDLALVGKKGRVTGDKGQGTPGMGNGTREAGQGTSDKGQGGRGVRNESWEELLYDAAIKSFESNLEKLRQLAPIDTICMHGSPLSRYDNKTIWEKYDYRNYGITGEPYLDVDFSKVLYLTDTGRRWDGEKVSIRDKVGIPSLAEPAWPVGRATAEKRDNPPSLKLRRVKGTPSFHSSFNIITAAKSGLLPGQLMITVHPQRWDDRMLPWIKELIWQRVKNGVKGVIAEK